MGQSPKGDRIVVGLPTSMIAHAMPELPCQHVATDLFEYDGADYVVLVDY